MKEIPKHYSLVHEHDDHFMVHDRRDNKAFPIAKKSLHPAHQIKLMKMQKFAEGGDVEAAPSTADFDAQALKDYEKGMTDPPQISPSQGPSPDQMMARGDFNQPPPQAAEPPPMMAPEEVQATPQPQAPEPQAPQQQPMNMNAPPQGAPTLQTLNNAVGQEAQGINMQAKGQVEQNKAIAQVQQAHLALEQDSMAKYQANMAKYQSQQEQLMKDVADQKINPDKYWDNHSRWGAAIAVMISGIGQGLSHQTNNMAMDAINDGMNKSIDSQKAELGKKQNLLSDNLRIQGNLMQAEQATRLQMNAMLQGKLALVAAQTGNPMIMGNAMQSIGKLKQAALPQQMSLAQYQTQLQMREHLSQGVNPDMDPEKFVQHVVPAEHQKKVYEEIAAAKHTAKSAPEILAAFDRAANNIHAMDFVPGKANADQKALHALMGPTFQDVEGTVRQAAMDNMNNNTTPEFGDNKNTIKTKRDALVGYLTSKSSGATTSLGNGIDLSKFKSTRADTGMHGAPQLFVNKKTGQTQMGSMVNGRFVPSGK